MWSNIENVVGLRQSDDKCFSFGRMLFVDFLLELIGYVLIGVVANGIATAFGMLYIFLRYRNKTTRKLALTKLYNSSYNYAGTAKIIQIIGGIWLFILLAILLLVLYVAIF